MYSGIWITVPLDLLQARMCSRMTWWGQPVLAITRTISPKWHRNIKNPLLTFTPGLKRLHWISSDVVIGDKVLVLRRLEDKNQSWPWSWSWRRRSFIYSTVDLTSVQTLFPLTNGNWSQSPCPSHTHIHTGIPISTAALIRRLLDLYNSPRKTAEDVNIVGGDDGQVISYAWVFSCPWLGSYGSLQQL